MNEAPAHIAMWAKRIRNWFCLNNGKLATRYLCIHLDIFYSATCAESGLHKPACRGHAQQAMLSQMDRATPIISRNLVNCCKNIRQMPSEKACNQARPSNTLKAITTAAVVGRLSRPLVACCINISILHSICRNATFEWNTACRNVPVAHS